MKKAMSKSLNIITVEDNTQRIICETLDEAIRYHKFLTREGFDTIICVNGIIMPDLEDETFFYASVKAAKDDKVWVEEAHGFFSKSFKDALEGGCLDDEDVKDFWEETIDRIYQDIFDYCPVTGEEGQAIVYDKYLAQKCEEAGYEVLPCTKEDKEEGMVDYYIIFPEGGEDEYFDEVYSKDDIKDEDWYIFDKNTRGKKLSLDKTHSKGKKSNSRRSKGIHKDRKNWKKVTKRCDRHQSKKVLACYSTTIDVEGLKEYFKEDGWTQIWVHNCKWYIYKDGKELFVPGADVYLFYEECDGEDLFSDEDMVFMTLEELVKMGLAE